MRNTKDIADAVFRIRDEYYEQKRVKNIRIKRYCAAVSSVAAVGLITAGSVYLLSENKPSSRGTEKISVIEEKTDTVTDITTTAKKDALSVTESTAAVSSVSSAAKTVTTVSSAVTGSTTESTAKAAATRTTSTAAAANTYNTTAVSAYTSDTKATTITIIDNDIDCEEVIRMKVKTMKKYLAGLTVAALSASTLQGTASAQPLYTPKPFAPETDAIIYIEANNDLLDFDSNGQFDAFDSYALYTYFNEAASLPDGYAEKCAENGDINQDGTVDSTDRDILMEYCQLKFTFDAFDDYANNSDYVLPSDTAVYTRTERSLSPDAPDVLKQNVFINSCYTYGSDANISSFIDYCFDKLNINWIPGTYDKYDDAYYKRFAEGVEKDNYSFDVNEDGKVDLKDLYEIYLYEEFEDNDYLVNGNYFARLKFKHEHFDIGGGAYIDRMYDDPDIILRDMLPVSDEVKQRIWEKCPSYFKYADSYLPHEENKRVVCALTPFELLTRYIMSNTEINMINTMDVYYVDYLGELNVEDQSASEYFVSTVKITLDRYFDSTNERATENIYSDKLNLDLINSPYTHDNDLLREKIDQLKEELDSGLTKDAYDINKDGKTDYYDSYVFSLYIDDLYDNITAENSIIPVDQWNYINQELDVDGDGITGSYVDYDLYTFVVGNYYKVPRYKLDIYYLRLIEQKGLVDLSDIQPYIEKLCKDKETGDVNLDGCITAVDASEVLSYYSDISTDTEINNVTEAKMEYMADYNADGIVDNRDASAILTVYAKNSVH